MKFFQMEFIKVQLPSFYSHCASKTLAREIGRASKRIWAKLVEIGSRRGARPVRQIFPKCTVQLRKAQFDFLGWIMILFDVIIVLLWYFYSYVPLLEDSFMK